ncbi:MAG: hypothetical protein ACRC7C_11855 [Beijerinckiaceae bacterium]
MSTLTLNPTARLGRNTAEVSVPSGRRSIFTRIVDAIAASNRRKADIEVRRILAMRAERKPDVDYALLPFAGE